MSTIGDFLASLKLGYGGAVDVFGISWGGAAALQFAQARGRADRMKRTRQRKKCQVMPSCLSQGPILSPTRHARIDEPGIARQRDIGTKAKSFHDARPEAFDEDIGLPDDPQAEISGGRFLEVEHKRALPAIDGRVGNCKKVRCAGPLDAQHIRPKVGQQHPAIGRWAKPGKFKHADAC